VAVVALQGFSTNFHLKCKIDVKPRSSRNWNITVCDLMVVQLTTVSIAVDPSPVIAFRNSYVMRSARSFEIRVNEITAGNRQQHQCGWECLLRYSRFTTYCFRLNLGSHTILIRDKMVVPIIKTITTDKPLVATSTQPLPSTQIMMVDVRSWQVAVVHTYTISPVAGTITANIISGLPVEPPPSILDCYATVQLQHCNIVGSTPVIFYNRQYSSFVCRR
jgi:hypothetical protein